MSIEQMKEIISFNDLGPNGECPETLGKCHHQQCAVMRHSKLIVLQCESLMKIMKEAHEEKDNG